MGRPAFDYYLHKIRRLKLSRKNKAFKNAIIERMSQKVFPDVVNTTAEQEDRPSKHVQTVKASVKSRNPRSYYNFSDCPTADHIREIFKGADIKDVEYIARTFRDIQLRTDGKRMTKKEYVEAIVKLYFPNVQPAPTPVQESKPALQGFQFEKGKIYVKGFSKDIRKNFSADTVFRVIKRTKDTVTIQEVFNPDFTPAFKPINKKIKIAHMPDTEYIRLSEDRDNIIFACSDYSDISNHLYVPSYDIDFDETAYSPDYQANSAVLDDVPAEREQNIQAASANVFNRRFDRLPECVKKGVTLREAVEEAKDREAMIVALKAEKDIYALRHCAEILYLSKVKYDKAGRIIRHYNKTELREAILAEVEHRKQEAKAENVSESHEPAHQDAVSDIFFTRPIPKHQQNNTNPRLRSLFYFEDKKLHKEKCRENRKIIDTLQTVEEIKALMLNFGMTNIFLQAIYDRITISAVSPRENDEQATLRFAETYAIRAENNSPPPAES